MKLEGTSLLGGRRGARGGKTFTGVNPVNGEALPVEFHSASVSDVEVAANAAAEAFAVYRRWPTARRVALLNRIAELLEANAAEIIARANLETALPTGRLQGELARTCFQLRFYGDGVASGLALGARIDHGDSKRQPLPKPDLRSMMIPLGPVAVFGASNFPLAYSVAGGDTASALAAGCPVIVKAHPAHPGTSEIVGLLVQQAVREMNAPDGLFSLLFDAGHEIGAALVKHPAIQAVGFTGSRQGGRALMDLAAARPQPIPVFAEMGSVNPVFVLGEALQTRAEEIAAGLHGSVTLGVGQFCTNPGLVFIEAGDGAKKFVAKLEELMKVTPAGTMLTAGLCSAYQRGAKKFSQIPGVTTVAAASDANSDRAVATLFRTDAETFLKNQELMEEVFGPSTLVVECASRAQMLNVARGLEGQLTATIHASPAELLASEELIDILTTKAGRLIYNGFPTGVEVAHAMTHGGPYPATSDGRSTSVGTRAVERFLRPVSFQNWPDAALPEALRDANPLGIVRLVDGKLKGSD